MSRLAARLLAALALVAASAAAALAADTAGEGCGVCHGAERVQHEASVHRGADVSCVTCHGGDPAARDAKAKAHSAVHGFRGRPSRREIADGCGGCHGDVVRMRPFGLRTDALAAWRTSHHGKAMTEKGLDDAATCTDCHGAHEVRRVKDGLSPAFRTNVPATCGRCHGDAARMARHGVTSTAVADFARSVHGTRLARGEPGVPSCADCHDAHAAAPPGANEVADVCGSCHRETRDRFRESPHFAASRDGRMQQCVTCHGNHAVGVPGYALFDAHADEAGDGHDGRRCLSCHDANDVKDAGAAAAIRFGASLRSTEASLHRAAGQVEMLAGEGFHVDDERDALERARRELVRAVPLSHTVDVVRVDAAVRHAASLVDEALEGCADKVRETRDRRIYGTAAGLVLLLVSAFLVLRRRPARRTQGAR